MSKKDFELIAKILKQHPPAPYDPYDSQGPSYKLTIQRNE
jgi:hypothetical protein